MNEALVNARKIRKWTQDKTAKRARVSRATLASLEQDGVPNLATGYRLADAFGCSVYDIFLPEYVEKLDNKGK